MIMRITAILAATLTLLGCGGPVPSGMYLTMSVSAYDVAVETSINGKMNEFLSGDSGNMTGSIPLNKFVSAGENTATFRLIPMGEGSDPEFLANLEITLEGEMVDTLQPGERTIFTRELTEEELKTVVFGGEVMITETFTVDPEALNAIKAQAQ